MLIRVTAEHIEEGKIGVDDTTSNAAACALQSVCKPGVSVWAAPDEIVLELEGDDEQTFLLTPTAVTEYLDWLEEGVPSEPFSFELDIPAKYLI